MSATLAAVLQTGTAATVAGVSLAFVAHVTGMDRVAWRVVRHPLVSFELGAAMIMSLFPAPKVKRRPRHRMVTA